MTEIEELRRALAEADRAAEGDSNDGEIEALRDALDLALARWPEVDNHAETVLGDNARVVAIAANLISEDGENLEYDRAISEMTCELVGLPLDEKESVLCVLRQTTGKPDPRG
jgi:hypothetical protein